jgi:hypothetical protein
MRQMLAFVLAIAIASGTALAVDPPAQPPTPVVAPSPAGVPQATLPKEQLDHLKSAAEHLASAGRKNEADKLREQIAAIEAGQAGACWRRKKRSSTRFRLKSSSFAS